MRTSKEMSIVELAEERFGVETDEEYIRRRDAFDGLMGYYPRNKKTGVVLKPYVKRVEAFQRKKVQRGNELERRTKT